jgi:hypothetical protein
VPFLQIPLHHSGGDWSLELWASERPYSDGPLAGIKVAEIALALPTPISPSTHWVDSWADARLPLQGRPARHGAGAGPAWSGCADERRQQGHTAGPRPQHISSRTVTSRRLIRARCAGGWRGSSDKKGELTLDGGDCPELVVDQRRAATSTFGATPGPSLSLLVHKFAQVSVDARADVGLQRGGAASIEVMTIVRRIMSTGLQSIHYHLARFFDRKSKSFRDIRQQFRNYTSHKLVCSILQIWTPKQSWKCGRHLAARARRASNHPLPSAGASYKRKLVQQLS